MYVYVRAYGSSGCLLVGRLGTAVAAVVVLRGGGGRVVVGLLWLLGPVVRARDNMLEDIVANHSFDEGMENPVTKQYYWTSNLDWPYHCASVESIFGWHANLTESSGAAMTFREICFEAINGGALFQCCSLHYDRHRCCRLCHLHLFFLVS